VNGVIARHPNEDRKRVHIIAERVCKEAFQGWTPEEKRQQLEWRVEQIKRHAETLPAAARYLQAEAQKLRDEAAHAEAEANELLEGNHG
jgi:hypothetical protein